MGGPPGWGLGEVLTTPHRKSYHDTQHFTGHRTWSDPLVHLNQWKRDFKSRDGGKEWIDLAQDRDWWRDIANVVMNLRVP